jgi:hypothetical protein
LASCSGGVKFSDLSREAAFNFQENLLKTMLQIEQTFFTLAENTLDRNVLVICDRGGMDPSACENFFCSSGFFFFATLFQKTFDKSI